MEVRDARLHGGARFSRENLGRVSILHVAGYLRKSAEEEFERALSQSFDGSPNLALIVSLLECGDVDDECVATLRRLAVLPTNRVHIVAAPNSHPWRMLQLGGCPFFIIHAGFQEAFVSISSESPQTVADRRAAEATTA